MSDNKKTVVLIAGNSDNKLSQQDWYHFCRHLHNAVATHACSIEFHGGSDPLAYWQNACWVVVIAEDHLLDSLKTRVKEIRETYDQDSVAVVVGTTEFL